MLQVPKFVLCHLTSLMSQSDLIGVKILDELGLPFAFFVTFEWMNLLSIIK
jgi:hypothetical protein